MAEGLLKKMLSEKGVEEYRVISAGTHTVDGYPPAHMTQKIMASQGIDVSSYRSNMLTRETINKSDIVVLVMTQEHKDEVSRIAPEKTKNIFLLKEFAEIKDKNPEIADPIGLSYDAYKYCMKEIEKCLIKIIKKIDG